MSGGNNVIVCVCCVLERARVRRTLRQWYSVNIYLPARVVNKVLLGGKKNKTQNMLKATEKA